MECTGRAQWLIVFLTYPLHTGAPFCRRFSFININCSFSNSTELLIPASVFHCIIFPVVLKKAAGGKKKKSGSGWVCAFFLNLGNSVGSQRALGFGTFLKC